MVKQMWKQMGELNFEKHLQAITLGQDEGRCAGGVAVVPDWVPTYVHYKKRQRSDGAATTASASRTAIQRAAAQPTMRQFLQQKVTSAQKYLFQQELAMHFFPYRHFLPKG
ncbi:hypothetical protein PsorP6_004926 [Peronosclerospora sorghi]|uniref:Uncharacterized protein n=1 Tax=Peronosclerospora sorghi TaxID=230839 RepID=A0ACC0W7L8_9STRA|nr:hypothetical protein PsorP6_004926 [Peronosclerospora sorghi]